MILARRIFHAALACFVAVTLTACSEKLTVSANGLDMPNYTEGETKTQPITTTPNNRKQQSVTFDKGTQKSTEKYVDWFKKNGWSAMKESYDPSAMQYIFEKEGRVATIAYGARTGLIITVDIPPSGGGAAK